MSSRTRGLRVAFTALAATSLVALGPGIASADEHGRVGDVVGGVKAGLEKGADQQGQLTPSSPSTSDQSADSSDSLEPGESRAKAEVAKVSLAGKDLVDLARSEARINKDDSAESDATLLAIGGNEIVGAHAKSDGEQESHAGDPFAQICEASGGQLCLRFLFADAYANEDETSSDALAKTGVADLCVGGTNTDPRNECDGQVHAGVLTSKAHTHRDKTTGATESDSESAGADVCAAPGDADTCGLGLEVLKSQSSSSSDGRSSGGSTIAGLEINGQKVVDLNQSQSGAIQPNCAPPSVVCADANKGETSAQDGVVDRSQDALDAGVLPDTAGGQVQLSHTEAGASAGQVAGVQSSAPEAGDNAGSGDNGDNGGTGGTGSGILPNTGGVWSGLLSIGLAAIAAGAFLLARKRRAVV